MCFMLNDDDDDIDDDDDDESGFCWCWIVDLTGPRFLFHFRSIQN